jgi:hypothetical protein
MSRERMNAPKSDRGDRTVPASRPGRSQGPVAPGLQLQHALGNRGVQRLVQAKLQVNQPGDSHEREADQLAELVVARTAEIGVQRKCACAGGEGERCPACLEIGSGMVRRKAESEGPAPSAGDGIFQHLGSGQPLEPAVCEAMEVGFSQDFGDVRIHTGPAAAEEAGRMRAQAFTAGSEIFFGAGRYQPNSREGRTLLAHELTHVVQQTRGGAPPVQRQQDAGAGGGGVPPSAPAPAGAPPITASPGSTPAAGSIADQVDQALSEVPEGAAAGVGDFPKAFSLLNGLAMFDMLAALDQLESRHRLELLHAHLGEAVNVNVARITAAIQMVRLARTPAAKITVGDLQQLINSLQTLPDEQRRDVLNYFLSKSGNVTNLEGLIAFLNPESPETQAPGGTAPPSVPGQTPGPMSGGGMMLGAAGAVYPRGRQSFSRYIGNVAHRSIADYYKGKHGGQLVFTNYYQVGTLLIEAGLKLGLTPDFSKASAGIDLKPDITNIDLLHLYEIKPKFLQSVASGEALMYYGLFRSAGIPMALGPTGDPGANGKISVGIGDFEWKSPEPGVIVYGFKAKGKGQQEQKGAQQAGVSTEAKVAVGVAAVGLLALVVIVCVLQPELIPFVVVAAEEGAEVTGATALATAAGTEIAVGGGELALLSSEEVAALITSAEAANDVAFFEEAAEFAVASGF